MPRTYDPRRYDDPCSPLWPDAAQPPPVEPLTLPS